MNVWGVLETMVDRVAKYRSASVGGNNFIEVPMDGISNFAIRVWLVVKRQSHRIGVHFGCLFVG